MTIEEAQGDMRQSYLNGGPGMMVSGVVWLAAGIVALVNTELISVLVFFLGGMLIHPPGYFAIQSFETLWATPKG